MQPREDRFHATEPAGKAASLGGGADSSNRPWETDSLRIGVAVAPGGLVGLAIAAAALLSLADMILLGSPADGHGFGRYVPLAGVPAWRLQLGHYLGVLLLPAYIPGYWLVFRGLRRAGGWLSWPVLLAGSYAAVLGGVVYGQIALLGLIVRDGGGGPAAAQLLGQADGLADPLHLVASTLFAVASLWFAVAVLSGRTLFPRWVAAANPLALALVFVVPNLAAPAWLPARLLAPAGFNLGHLVFFSLVAVALRRRPERPPP